MTSASMMASAKGRLLPALTPLRFFVAAAVFHVLAWAALALDWRDAAHFAGGPGLTLAALHLATLGVASMAAFGATLQLLPVATRAPIGSVALANLSFWLLVPGVAVLTGGMAAQSAPTMIAGAALTGLAFALFAALTWRNLARAPTRDATIHFVQAALVALIVFVGLGAALALDGRFGFLDRHMGAARAHMTLAAFGFFGLLIAGFGAVLLPMFALASPPPQRAMTVVLGLIAAASAVAAMGLAAETGALALVGGVLGSVAAAAYVFVVERSLATRLRRTLGAEFRLVRASEAALIAAVLLGLALLAGAPVARGEALFGWLMISGWLLSFLTGVLQRILPFLTSMHVKDARGRTPLASTLAPRLPLDIHSACHFAAVLLVGLGIALDVSALVLAGALIGLCGAGAFVWFALAVVAHLKPQPAGQQGQKP